MSGAGDLPHPEGTAIRLVVNTEARTQDGDIGLRIQEQNRLAQIAADECGPRHRDIRCLGHTRRGGYRAGTDAATGEGLRQSRAGTGAVDQKTLINPGQRLDGVVVGEHPEG